MSSVAEHYENHLAKYYSWMFGDFAAKVEANRQFFNFNGIVPQKTGTAADLGAGSGFQSIALAQLGFKVLAVDLSQKLLEELKSNSGTLPVTTVRDDMLNFAAHCPNPVEVCVCMGDTLPHLDSLDKVTTLFERVYGALAQDGKFVMTFRDLSVELKGLEHFIPVRSDANTVFTCFLEYEAQHVKVHDLIYTRNRDKWELLKSSYRKLRIPFEWVRAQLNEIGFSIQLSENNNGMITVIAGKTIQGKNDGRS